jgi:hypothetical protein
MIDWKSDQTCAAIGLRVCGREGWPTTLSSEQHDWMKLLHESPELKRKSRSGIPTLRNLLPAKACSIAPWYYQDFLTSQSVVHASLNVQDRAL